MLLLRHASAEPLNRACFACVQNVHDILSQALEVLCTAVVFLLLFAAELTRWCRHNVGIAVGRSTTQPSFEGECWSQEVLTQSFFFFFGTLWFWLLYTHNPLRLCFLTGNDTRYPPPGPIFEAPASVYSTASRVSLLGRAAFERSRRYESCVLKRVVVLVPNRTPFSLPSNRALKNGPGSWGGGVILYRLRFFLYSSYGFELLSYFDYARVIFHLSLVLLPADKGRWGHTILVKHSHKDGPSHN